MAFAICGASPSSAEAGCISEPSDKTARIVPCRTVPRGVGVTLFLSALNFRPNGGAAAAQSSVLDISKISVQKLERDFRRFDFETYIYAEIIQKLERAR
ncbi:MAG TPA: hypothetical protein VGP08_20560 [Pyrinomonadaceae bacterium]|jgi:hypothetical protein|nr:hypothetical protein [Pyrinomonadaceae bacterium]